MNRKAMRKLAETDPDALRRAIKGARQRELTARHLLLNPDQVATASDADREALKEYLADKRWRSLYGHDRRMYRMLRAGAEKLMAQAGAAFLPKRKTNERTG